MLVLRFSIHKSMLEMCNTLKEAITYMYQSETTDLIDGCLDMLVSINSTLLENDVTEFDFNIITNISDEFNSQNVDLQKVYDLVFDLENEIKTNVKYKLKVLFVAEDSSKWDAMASVYENIAKRDDCEVQATIEPYFRATKMPDGTTKSEVVLEDHLSPLGIPTIYWQNYDFEKELPDITFFSQPYESCTSEKFWPMNMAKYTKLVYLPYYTARTINRNIGTATFHSFFKSDSERYCWKIIAQSEIMKKHYKSFASKKGENVIVTGLPKWDYPMQLTKEKVNCPENWKKKIDGRKVFLFNTHYTEPLSDPINFETWKKLIDVFLKNKKAALIWRPHPLTEMVIRVYKSAFWAEYKELKDKIEKSENIIYDDESSYEVSFAYSDALISVNSSLVVQFLLVNKPILLAYNTESISEWKGKLATNDGLFDLTKFPFACELDDKKKFINDIIDEKDEWKEQRQELLDNYLALADGKCGERVVESIIAAFKEEQEDKEIEINPAKTVLIVGNEKDSELCVKQLKKNAVNYVFAKEFLNESYCKDEKTSLFEVNTKQFDLFVVTDKNYSVATDMLEDELNVPREKIIPFWQFYNATLPTRICDRIMMNPSHKGFDGVILGMGNAEVGIILSQLKASFCNLAVSSQDVYYNLKTLEYCYENYYEKLKNLKYAIVDLNDYNYFNFDTSLSASVVKYLGSGGYNLDAHNFANNKNYNGEYSAYVEQIENFNLDGLNEVNIAQWSLNFSNVHELDNFEGFNSVYNDLSFRKNIVNDQQVASYAYERASVVQVFEKTVKENKKHLEKLLALLLKINPEIKVCLTVLPKFVEVETHDANELYKHKAVFYEIIEDLKSKFKFEFIDFKTSSDIMYNRNYFFDANHLNYYGAMCLTKELNDKMFN